MKIAVTARGEEENRQLDSRFGRAAGFEIVDTERGKPVACDNEQNLNALRAAGDRWRHRFFAAASPEGEKQDGQ